MPVSYGKHSNLTAFEIKTSVLQNAWPFYVYQSDQRASEYISLMWTLLSDWHIRFAERCLWYLKYSLFWCLVGGVSITQCYFTQYLSITTLENTGLFMIVFHLDYFFFIIKYSPASLILEFEIWRLNGLIVICNWSHF